MKKSKKKLKSKDPPSREDILPPERTKLSILDLLEQKVDLNKLLSNATLNEDELIEAALMQPTLIANAGIFRVQRFHRRTLYEARLALAKSEVGLRFRRIRDTSGRKEHSEAAVKERIELDPTVRKLTKRVNTAYSEEEIGKLLMEVFRTRSDAIRTIVNAGKVSVHAKELEILKANKKLRKSVYQLRDNWNKSQEED